MTNSSIVFDKDTVANKLNEYFCELWPKLAESIASPHLNYRSNPHMNYRSNIDTPCLDNLIFEYSTTEEITKHIQNLKPKSSSGYDQISSKVFK